MIERVSDCRPVGVPGDAICLHIAICTTALASPCIDTDSQILSFCTHQAFMTRLILNWHSEYSFSRRPTLSNSAHVLRYFFAAHSRKLAWSSWPGRALCATANLFTCQHGPGRWLVVHIRRLTSSRSALSRQRTPCS